MFQWSDGRKNESLECGDYLYKTWFEFKIYRNGNIYCPHLGCFEKMSLISELTPTILGGLKTDVIKTKKDHTETETDWLQEPK